MTYHASLHYKADLSGALQKGQQLGTHVDGRLYVVEDYEVSYPSHEGDEPTTPTTTVYLRFATPDDFDRWQEQASV